jgi:hypothetical protein
MKKAIVKGFKTIFVDLTPEEEAEVLQRKQENEALAAITEAQEEKVNQTIPQEAKAWLQAHPTVKALVTADLSVSEAEIMSWDLTTAAGRNKLLVSIVALLEFCRLMAYKDGLIE